MRRSGWRALGLVAGLLLGSSLVACGPGRCVHAANGDYYMGSVGNHQYTVTCPLSHPYYSTGSRKCYSTRTCGGRSENPR